MSASIKAQATAVERAALNLAGHIRTLRGLVQAGKRPAHELHIAETFHTELHAAALTMKEIAKSEAA